MENKEVDSALLRMYDNTDYIGESGDFAKVFAYIEKLERENFGLRQQVSNLKEKDEKVYRYYD